MFKKVLVLIILLLTISCDPYRYYELVQSTNSYEFKQEEDSTYVFTDDGILMKIKMLQIGIMLHVRVLMNNLQYDLVEFNTNQFRISINNKLKDWKVRIGNRLVNKDYISQLSRGDVTEIVYLVDIKEKEVNEIVISLGNINLPNENKSIKIEEFTFSPFEELD